MSWLFKSFQSDDPDSSEQDHDDHNSSTTPRGIKDDLSAPTNLTPLLMVDNKTLLIMQIWYYLVIFFFLLLRFVLDAEVVYINPYLSDGWRSSMVALLLW